MKLRNGLLQFTPLLHSQQAKHLLLGSLDGGLGDLSGLVNLGNGLDDTDSNGLSHVTDGETTEWWVFREGFDAHWLRWNHLDDGSITRLDELGAVFNRLASTTIDLLEKLGELASNVGSVAIKNWSITSTNLTWMVEDDDLSVEGFSTLWWIVLGVTSDVSTTNFLDGDVLDVEADVVSWNTLDELFVVHFNGLDFSGDTSWGEGDDHTGLDDTGFNTTDWHRADTSDLVDILEWETEWLVSWAGRWVNGINGLEKSLASNLGLGLLLPTLVPWAVVGWGDHVVTIETRDWNEWDVLWVVSNLLDKVGGFLDDFVKTILGPLGGVHLVDGNDELTDTQGEGKESVFTGLTILGDTGFEFTSTGGDDENGTISLGGSSDHVLDEVTMTRGINDGEIVPRSFKLPESNIDSDTTFTFSLEFVENPGILEGTLAKFGGFLLELLNGTLVDTSALVDQVSSCG